MERGSLNLQNYCCRRPKFVAVLFCLLFQLCFLSSFCVSNVEATSEVSSSFRHFLVTTLRGGSAASEEKVQEEATASTSLEGKMDDKTDDIWTVFSDLDGTLIHYPESKIQSGKRGNSILKLPPSSTGRRGVISSQTLCLVREVRQSTKFALVSGMRTTTLFSRLPYLPKADAYCTEGGGRIFYPSDDITKDSLVITPEKFDGATAEDMKPFALVEDVAWRKRMEQTCGDFATCSLKELAEGSVKLPGVNERDGLLWDFARSLMAKGYVLDTKGYNACFRVNVKQQDPAAATDAVFESLLDGTTPPFKGLSTSVNLSCIDYYPENSGKKNCCQYLAEKFRPEDVKERKHLLLPSHAICLCDDDNDLEMAMACSHAFIPEVSSKSMADVIEENPDHFTQTGGEGTGHNGPEASEIALQKALDLIAVRNAQSSSTLAP